MVSGTPGKEIVVIAGNQNGHVDANSDGYEETHDGFGFQLRNSADEKILEFCDTVRLTISNTVLREDKRLITYKSGGRGTKSILDYILLSMLKNIKVILGEESASQHHVIVGNFSMRELQKSKGKKLYVLSL